MLDQTHPVSVFLAQLCLHLLLLSYCLGDVSEGIRDEGWGEQMGMEEKAIGGSKRGRGQGMWYG